MYRRTDPSVTSEISHRPDLRGAFFMCDKTPAVVERVTVSSCSVFVAYIFALVAC